jgi:phospholipid/cholesterol/gamma-HCH transport system substrate-binding protein
MRNTLETRLGMFVALAIVVTVILVEMLGGTDFFQRGKVIRGYFANVQDLKVGDRVKMAGVEIGRVNAMNLIYTNNTVEVRLKLKPRTTVRSDSVASIKFTGLMGQNYVSIDFGSGRGEPLENNSVIATVETSDLGAMMAKLDSVATGVQKLTESFSGEKIDNLMGPLIGTIQDIRPSLTSTVSNINKITYQVAQGQGTVGKLIFDESSTNLYNSAMATVTNLQSTADEIKTTVAEARKIIDQARAGQGTVGRLLTDEKLYTEATASMTNLKEILEKINQGKGSVGKILNDEDLYKNAKLTLQKLDKATEGLEDQGPLSVMGILVGRLF